MQPLSVDLQFADILYVEDDEEYVTLVRRMVDPAYIGLTWAKDLAEARKCLADGPYDLVLLDYVLPDGNGLSFIEELKTSWPDTPVIVLSGRKDEAMAVSSIKKGASDFVLKEEMWKDLISAIDEVLRQNSLTSYKMTATDHMTPWLEPYSEHGRGRFKGRFLDASREVFQTILSALKDGCLVVDIDGVVTFVNSSLEKMIGLEENHLLGGNLWEIFDDDTTQKIHGIRGTFKRSGQAGSFSLEGRLVKGAAEAPADLHSVLISGHPLHDRAGRYKACLLVVTL